ncbi:MAG: hypothetical protein RRA51_03090, partial [Armatimonadota bacterium]|nr:hypothetical protein [Armatimonadota bacterium]
DLGMSLMPLLQVIKQPKPFTSGCAQSDQQWCEKPFSTRWEHCPPENSSSATCYSLLATHYSPVAAVLPTIP